MGCVVLDALFHGLKPGPHVLLKLCNCVMCLCLLRHDRLVCHLYHLQDLVFCGEGGGR